MPEYGEPSDDESVDREDQENHADIQLELERLRELEEVQVLIDKLNFEEPFTAKEFVLYDESEITTGMISDEEILKAVQPNNQEKEKVEKEPLLTITHNEVIECYDKVRSEEHTSELQSQSNLVCRLLLEKKNTIKL